VNLAQAPTLADFGQDVWWLIIIKVVAAFAFGVVMTLLGVWFERRMIGWMQVRPGPNRAGPFGLLQTLADGLKMAFKEDLRPRGADRLVFLIAPAISAVCALTALSVIPFGPMVSIFGERTPLQVTDVPVAVLVLLAVSALSVYGVVLGGWASGSPYPLLGGMRASAQMISYEVALGLSTVAVLLLAGNVSLSEIVARQSASPFTWNVFPLSLAFGIFLVSAFAETNRLPFDLPEAESELVAGFGTEYGSMKWALFYSAEYINMAALSMLLSVLYLGGWNLPGVDLPNTWAGVLAGGGIMFAKLTLMMFFFVWVRFTFPRFRYDQLMRLGWKTLLPIALVTLVGVAVLVLSGVY
jgi:NADH-quinone oxidoreductase subunit H